MTDLQTRAFSFPRLRGDEPGGHPAVENYLTFSPPTRG